MKTSKVKTVQGNGTWVSPDNTTYFKHEYEMEDGTILNALHKTQNPFTAGAEVEYEVTKENEYGKSGKVKKIGSGNFQRGGKTDTKGIEIGHAINNGVQLAIADCDMSIQNIEKRAREIYTLAQNMKAEQAPKEQPKPTGNIEGNFQNDAVNGIADQQDDLPF